MNKNDLLSLLEEMLEQPAGTLTGSERLDQLENWDSLAILSFISLVDEKFQMSVPAKDVSRAATVDDLMSLVGVHAAGDVPRA